MNITALKTIVILAMLVFVSGLAVGQQAALKDSKIEQLKDEVQKRELLDRDVTIPADLKAQNQTYLTSRRAELRSLLQARSDALHKYKLVVGTFLTTDERGLLESSIREVDGDLQRLSQGGAPNSSVVIKIERPPDKLPEAMSKNNGEPDVKKAANDDSEVEAAAEPQPLAKPLKTTFKNTSNTFKAASGEEPVQDCQSYEQNPKTFSLYQKYACRIAADVKRRKQQGRPAATTVLARNLFDYTVILLAKKERPSYIVEAEEARVDKQVGGGSSNSGSTSLVIKGGAPSVLGFAVENGALARSVTGTTLTFRGNPVGLYQALSNKGFLSGFESTENDPATRFLEKTSFSLSFDTSRGRQPGVFTADQQQLSAFSVRYAFINERDPRHKKYEETWAEFLDQEGLELTTSANDLKIALTTDGKDFQGNRAKVFKDQALQQWYAETQTVLAGATVAEVETKLRQQLNKLPFDQLSPDAVAALNNFSTQFESYLTAKDKILERIAKGNIVTFEYTNNREVNAPDTSNFMFIAETGLFGGKVDLTANAGLAVFHKTPAGVNLNRLRDFNFATQLDVPFAGVRGLGQFVFSVAGKYQRLTGNAVAFDGTVFPNTRGDIAIGQVKLTVPIKGTGFKIPLALTFSNRTELVREREVRGNFGFTFDLDTLFARFKPF